MVMIPMVSMAMVSIVIRHVCQVMTSLAVGSLSCQIRKFKVRPTVYVRKVSYLIW